VLLLLKIHSISRESGLQMTSVYISATGEPELRACVVENKSKDGEARSQLEFDNNVVVVMRLRQMASSGERRS
jgi:hypothetical protein